MHFETKRLAHALDIAAMTIERRNTIPILGCALLDLIVDGDGEHISIMGTDLDMQIRTLVPVTERSKSESFDLAMFAPDKIARLIRTAGESVRLDKVDATRIRIQGGGLDATIGSLPGEDFPLLTMAPEEDCFAATLGLAQLDMILRVAGAVSTEETRYYLNGVYMHHLDGWTYRVVATDGHRLYTGTIELPDAVRPLGKHKGGKDSEGIIIPRKTIQLLRKLRPRMDAEAGVRMKAGGAGPLPNRDRDLAPDSPLSGYTTRARFSFKAGATRVELATKLIDGAFPDYTRVIPSRDPAYPTIAFKRRDLAAALDAITCGMHERTRPVKLVFDPAGKLIVSSKWIDFGFEGKVAIDAKSSVTQPFEVGYNSKYLRNIIDANVGEDLSINTADQASPGSIVDPDATDFQAVLMPMRV